MSQELLADFVVAVHLGYVLYVILTQFAVLAGALLGWRWIRRPALRIVHLVCAWIPAVIALLGRWCPLTDLELELRRRAGQEPEEVGFIARILRELLYVDVAPGVLGASYVAFALLVSATFYWVRPGRKAAHSSA